MAVKTEIERYLSRGTEQSLDEGSDIMVVQKNVDGEAGVRVTVTIQLAFQALDPAGVSREKIKAAEGILKQPVFNYQSDIIRKMREQGLIFVANAKVS